MADSMEWEPFGINMHRMIMGYNKNIMLVKVKFDDGGLAAMHAHPHTQTSFIESGVFEFTVGEKSMIVKAGDGVLIDPNVPHACRCIEPGMVIDTFSPMREDFIKY